MRKERRPVLASVTACLCSSSLSCAAFWDATRAFMLLAVLSCFAGVVLGLSAFTNGTKNRRVRTGGIALLLSGNTPGAPSAATQTAAAAFLSIIDDLPTPTITHTFPGFLALLALAIYTGVTVTFFGKRFLDWRFSWSYIIGWVAIILAFAAGTSLFFFLKKINFPKNVAFECWV